ncbi:hypothetical protein HOLleu_03155 [Holothuria leucospilota]|uniref:Secreted protein n=1 Tax=Holothuria leucospilota TaxID=206669 RepID=A0A9Q1CSN2_HOLLE|nr:hypothetical protein HOLleu_03155 [Holothuria leucospilota]
MSGALFPTLSRLLLVVVGWRLRFLLPFEEAVTLETAFLASLFEAARPLVFTLFKDLPSKTSPATAMPVRKASFPKALAPFLSKGTAERNNPPSILSIPCPRCPRPPRKTGSP